MRQRVELRTGLLRPFASGDLGVLAVHPRDIDASRSPVERGSMARSHTPTFAEEPTNCDRSTTLAGRVPVRSQSLASLLSCRALPSAKCPNARRADARTGAKV